ncbi:MAG: hypothetical protein H7Z71_00395 [Moraxellaceae bacterium]|nr:hypothetical protein [Pseudobdellovibrionaceae bacterium]
MRKFILSVLVCLTFSCSPDNLPDFNKIESPRVIALMADKPEANPGDTITITPVISDLAAVSGVQDSIQVCIDLGISFGASPTCEGNPTKIVVQNHRVLTLPGVGENWTGSADSFSFSLPINAIIFNRRSAQDQFNGVDYLIEYTLHSTIGTDVTAIKRISVSESTKSNKNLNPTFSDIFSDGVSMLNLPVGLLVHLSNNLNLSSAENYAIKDAQGGLKNYTEELTVTWFITDGKTKYYRSLVGGLNEYTGPGAAPVGRSAYILAVARDNRGGVFVVKRKLN